MKVRLDDGITIDTRQFKYMGADVDRHDNVRVFVRRNGLKRRIRDWSSVEAFVAEYRLLLYGPKQEPKKVKHASPNTLDWLIQRYYQSPEFKALAWRTQKVRRQILEKVCGGRFGNEMSHGEKPYALMEPKHVRRIRDEKSETPESANARVRALRAVYKWAVDADEAEKNPAKVVPLIVTGSDGWHTWTREEIIRFEATHPVGTKARLALALLLFTGVRRSDVVGLGKQMETPDGKLRFVETKGKNRHPKQREIPVLPVLRHLIDVTPSEHLTYLVTSTGRPFTHGYFGNWFRTQCNAAGLEHCSAHGLRKAGATIAAENGATEHQLMAIYGWETTKQAGVYTKKANRNRLANDAMHLVVPEQNMDKSVPLSDPVRISGTNRGKK